MSDGATAAPTVFHSDEKDRVLWATILNSFVCGIRIPSVCDNEFFELSWHFGKHEFAVANKRENMWKLQKYPDILDFNIRTLNSGR